jgi:thiosulfate reductase cytochrome b subunit
MKVSPPQSIAVKVFHWINLLSVSTMLLSGLQIYNANPVFGGREGLHLPSIFLLGGWLAGGRDWHFAAMTLFSVNLFCYGLYVLLSRRWNIRFVSSRDVKALQGENVKRKFYSWHRVAYTAIVPVLLIAILSGIGMYKSAQFDWIVKLFGDDWQALRIAHFMTVPIVLAFIPIHVLLALRVGKQKLIESMFW